MILLLPVTAFQAGCEDAQNRASTHAANPDVPKSQIGVIFTEVTEMAGLGEFHYDNGAVGDKWFPEVMGAGCGFIDYNGDGWLDILLAGGAHWQDNDIKALRLYENDRSGKFKDVTAAAGLADIRTYGFGITVADYDNDGDEDFYFTTLYDNMLFRNDQGSFVEVGKQAGVAGGNFWSASALFFDADRDGWLDLYVGNYVDWTPETDIFCSLTGQQKGYCTPELYTGVAGFFFRSNGDGTFSDRTKEAGLLPSRGKTLGLVDFDYNRDGWTDFMAANDTEPDLLFENNGNGTFTEKGTISGISYDENGKTRAGMGIDAGVVDDTGEESVFVGNFSKEMIGVYRHAQNGLFVDRAALSKIGRETLLTLTFGLFLFDFDLDGDLDLYAANGHVQERIQVAQDNITYEQAPHLFQNDGTGIFTDVREKTGTALTQRMVGRGAAYGDYDRDGDLDILVTDNRGPAHLFRNDIADGRHFVRLRLRGTKSNSDAIGSDVRLYADGKAQIRRVKGGSSFQSSSEKVLTFGLGSGNKVDSLVVKWPAGKTTSFAEIPIDREIIVEEGGNKIMLAK